MASHTDERTASRHRPLSGVRGMRSAVAFLRFHEQDLVFGGVEDFDGFRYCGCVDPILGIHEELAAGIDRRPGLFHLRHNALIHHRFRYMLANRLLIARLTEIASEWFLADDVLSSAHGVDDHLGM